MSTSKPAMPNVTTIALILSSAVAVFLIFFYDNDAHLALSTNEESANKKSINENSNTLNHSATSANTPDKTIATVWNWSTPNKANDSDLDSSPAAFSEKAVYNALQRVRLDAQDNIIIDHEALIALNETLDNSRLQLDAQSLIDLQSIIRQGLPGQAGEEVAIIVANFYNYLTAKKEFNAIYENISSPQPTESTIEAHEENYRELMSLRELYLGTDVANQLFETTDANANYMFEMLKVEQANHLTKEERSQKRIEIIDKHTEDTIDISNWNVRYKAFMAAKQNIQSAAISKAEKQAQLSELMQQHFSAEELNHVRHLQLDQP